VEELEALEAVNEINCDMSFLEEGLMPGTLALDWSAFMPSILKGNSGFNELIGALHDTALVAVSNLWGLFLVPMCSLSCCILTI
jgi:hypothetical protein